MTLVLNGVKIVVKDIKLDAMVDLEIIDADIVDEDELIGSLHESIHEKAQAVAEGREY
jgi:hypothetical protein